jgi:hypothetical protein
MRFNKRLLAVLLVGVALVSTHAAEDAPAPYRLVILVAYGEPLGPESLRDGLERELAERLELDRCFESVVRSMSEIDAAKEADLIVEVILDGYREDTHHDVSIATQNRLGEPGSDLQWNANVEAMVHLQVFRAGDRALVKMKRKQVSVTRRAQPAEDTRFEARSNFFEAIVRKARSYLCGVSPKRWEKLIEQARLM